MGSNTGQQFIFFVGPNAGQQFIVFLCGIERERSNAGQQFIFPCGLERGTTVYFLCGLEHTIMWMVHPAISSLTSRRFFGLLTAGLLV